jgi:hypothetical protein
MEENDLVPDLNTVNAIIESINKNHNLKTDKLINEIIYHLNKMKNFGIKPNLSTFNNALKNLSVNQTFHVNIVPFVLSILKEMEILQIGNSN